MNIDSTGNTIHTSHVSRSSVLTTNSDAMMHPIITDRYTNMLSTTR